MKEYKQFLAEVAIQSEFDLDYAGREGQDGNIHIRIGDGAGSVVHKNVPIKVEDKVVDANDILAFVKSNMEDIVVKKEHLNKEVFLSKQLQRDPMIVVNKDVELKIVEDDDQRKSDASILVISLARKGRSIGRKSLEKFANKISNRFRSMTRRSDLL